VHSAAWYPKRRPRDGTRVGAGGHTPTHSLTSLADEGTSARRSECGYAERVAWDPGGTTACCPRPTYRRESTVMIGQVQDVASRGGFDRARHGLRPPAFAAGVCRCTRCAAPSTPTRPRSEPPRLRWWPNPPPEEDVRNDDDSKDQEHRPRRQLRPGTPGVGQSKRPAKLPATADFAAKATPRYSRAGSTSSQRRSRAPSNTNQHRMSTGRATPSSPRQRVPSRGGE